SQDISFGIGAGRGPENGSGDIGVLFDFKYNDYGLSGGIGIKNLDSNYYTSGYLTWSLNAKYYYYETNDFNFFASIGYGINNFSNSYLRVSEDYYKYFIVENKGGCFSKVFQETFKGIHFLTGITRFAEGDDIYFNFNIGMKYILHQEIKRYNYFLNEIHYSQGFYPVVGFFAGFSVS
ncbi:MAG: hypothetical protein ACOC22_04095, partial [bacterium]